jgi:hypothetical protein
MWQFKCGVRVLLKLDVGSSEIWILGQLDELQALESKYPTILLPSFSRTGVRTKIKILKKDATAIHCKI